MRYFVQDPPAWSGRSGGATRAFVVTAPTSPVVTWEQADARLKLDGDVSQQSDVEDMIASATEHLEGPDGSLGRALAPQTIEMRLDDFLSQDIKLPCPPIIGIVSVKYLDPTGVLQTVDPAAYELQGRVLVPSFGNVWPSTAAHPEAVRIQYRAGYVVDATADPLVPKLPAAISAAILLMTGDFYRFRETASEGSRGVPTAIPMSVPVSDLLWPFRTWS